MMNITRRGVSSRVLPISACRPTGPPTSSERPAPIGSVRLGRSRSSALRRSAAKGRGRHRGPRLLGRRSRGAAAGRSRSDHRAGGGTGTGSGGGGGPIGTVVGGPSGIVMPGATSILGWMTVSLGGGGGGRRRAGLDHRRCRAPRRTRRPRRASGRTRRRCPSGAVHRRLPDVGRDAEP